MTHPIAIGTRIKVAAGHSELTDTIYVVDSYNDEDYMKMVCENNKQITMSLHPEHVRRIVANDGDSGVTVVDSVSRENVTIVTPIETNVNATVAKQATEKKTELAENKAEKGPSKKEQARAIRQANPNASRKELIAMFMTQLNMTAAGASTYASYKD